MVKENVLEMDRVLQYRLEGKRVNILGCWRIIMQWCVNQSFATVLQGHVVSNFMINVCN